MIKIKNTPAYALPNEKNLWRLSKLEKQVLGAVANHGTYKACQKELGFGNKKIENALLKCRKKMAAANTTVAAVMFDRATRSGNEQATTH